MDPDVSRGSIFALPAPPGPGNHQREHPVHLVEARRRSCHNQRQKRHLPARAGLGIDHLTGQFAAGAGDPQRQWELRHGRQAAAHEEPGFAQNLPVTPIGNAIRDLLSQRPGSTGIRVPLACCAAISVVACAFAMAACCRRIF